MSYNQVRIRRSMTGIFLLFIFFHSVFPQNVEGNWGGSHTNKTRGCKTNGVTCDRQCGGQAMTCCFEFVVERYTVLNAACGNCTDGVKEDCYLPQCVPADGFRKPIVTVNRALAGSPIVACRGDTIEVYVHNRMPDLSTTVHWHGISQFGTPHMDGVPMVTQCPILPFDTFKYKFKVDVAGTFFWHAHVGTQKLDGMSGPLIVRDAISEEVHRDLYDEDLTEHVIFVLDWIHTTSDYWLPGQHEPGSLRVADSVLINGVGPLWKNGSYDFVPMANFTVESGKKYRFRLIGSTSLVCIFALKIQSHRLTIITTDGGLNVEPTIVDSININSGDRFDFILKANQEIGTYQIFLENLSEICGSFRQIGVLHYKDSSSSPSNPAPPTGDLGVILNPPMSPCDGSNPNEICVSNLVGLTNAPSVASATGNYEQISLGWGNYYYSPDELFQEGTYKYYEEPQYESMSRFLINNITYSSPSSPLLSQYEDIPQDNFCSPKCYTMEVEEPCHCTNIYHFPLNALVDLVVYDTENLFSHPYHQHGYNFYVLKMGIFSSGDPSIVEAEVNQLLDDARNDRYSLENRPMKDSITIQSAGYAVLRFSADNPGWWLIHCHYAYHQVSGKAAVFKVGNDHDIPTVPKKFPRCGNYYEE